VCVCVGGGGSPLGPGISPRPGKSEPGPHCHALFHLFASPTNFVSFGFFYFFGVRSKYLTPPPKKRREIERERGTQLARKRHQLTPLLLPLSCHAFCGTKLNSTQLKLTLLYFTFLPNGSSSWQRTREER